MVSEILKPRKDEISNSDQKSKKEKVNEWWGRLKLTLRPHVQTEWSNEANLKSFYCAMRFKEIDFWLGI